MITKEEFVNKINVLKDFNDCIRQIEDAVPYFNAWESFPSFGIVFDKYIELLVSLTEAPIYNEYGYTNDIELFVYEYDFGREYDGSYTYTDDDNNTHVIDFYTPENLYDFITKGEFNGKTNISNK